MLTIGDPMIDSLSESYRNAITAIGENPEREGLLDTPKRAAKALEFLTSGYRQDLETLVNGAVFESENDEMVVVRDIELYSMCEHHMLPLPAGVILATCQTVRYWGCQQFARITDMYARRLQIQENLTREIALAVQSVTGARGVGVVVEASHFCMMMRGVEKQNSTMASSVMLGDFRDHQATRSEFLRLIGKC